MRRQALTAIVALLALTPVVLGVVATGDALADNHGDNSDAVTVDNSTTYDIATLRRGGTTPGSDGDVPDSVRRLDRFSALAIRYDGVGLIARSNMFLSSSDTVRRDEIRIQSRRPFEASLIDDSSYQLVVVYWQPKQVRVSDGNATRSTTVASNQTVEYHDLTLGSGYKTATISLREHSQPTHVTMWLKSKPDVRWRFTHHSTPFSESVLIDSEGDFWQRAIMQIGFPTLATCAFAGVAVPASIRRAGAGPQWGLLPWAIILSLATIFGLLFASVQLSGLVVAMPYVVPLFIGGLVGIIFLERYEDGVEKIVAFRLDTKPKKTPSGDLAKEAIGGQFNTYKVTKLPDGDLAVIPTGLIAFFARVFGQGARLAGASRINAEIDLYDSPADKLLFVATDADELIDIDKEGFAFDNPLTNHEGEFEPLGVLNAAVVFTLPGALFGVLVGPAVGLLAGALGIALVYVQAKGGAAVIDPAVGQSEDAYATAFYLEKSLEEYETFEGLIRALRSEKNRSEDILEMIEEQGAEALIQRAHDRDSDPEELKEMFSNDAKGVEGEGTGVAD